MPTAHPGMGQQLTPVDSTSNSRSCFIRSHLPSWAAVQLGLSIFALAVIARSLLQRLHSWITRSFTQSHQPHLQDLLRYRAQNNQSWSPHLHERALQGMSEKRQNRAMVVDPQAQRWKASLESMPRSLMSRPPPAPPLTPPELSTTVFTYEERSRSQQSFIHQPNPDYTSESPVSPEDHSVSMSPLTSRRRSYNKTLPIGIPTQPTRSVSEADAVADLTTSPSSYPPTSPLLPPPPPGFPAWADGTKARNIDVQGEIISLLDGDGAGWSRHTRVYGGGVCLACAAAGTDHGGGFYGSTVRPEEMR